MTHKLSYSMSSHPQPLRRENRESFVRTTETMGSVHTKISVLMLCYNHLEQFFSLLDHIDRDPQRDSFTITIVQNSDRQESLDAFEKRIINYNNITVIYPTHNLGSA